MIFKISFLFIVLTVVFFFFRNRIIDFFANNFSKETAEKVDLVGQRMVNKTFGKIKKDDSIVSKILKKFFPSWYNSENEESLKDFMEIIEPLVSEVDEDIFGVADILSKKNGKYSRVIITEDEDMPFQLNEKIFLTTQKIIQGKTGEEQKARAIFDWFKKNIQYGEAKRGFDAYRTSEKVFETSEGVCGEMAVLYVVMARTAGIKANYVHVDIDYHGEEVNHACSLIRIKKSDILVDPAYNQFDVKHQKFSIVSDKEAIGKFRAYREKQ